MPIRRTSSGSSQDTGFYNPEIFSDVGSRLVFPTDPDAAAYIAAVESADGQELEFPIKVAYNDFVLGCKADGIWTAIKASCIMAGARTLAGALTPLVGTAPTNNNFVAGDYSRTTGLVGDGSTKYLDSNRNNNADPQNSKHISVYATTLNTVGFAMIGTEEGAVGGATQLSVNSGVVGSRLNSSTNVSHPSTATAGLLGASRSDSSNVSIRNAGSTVVLAATSQVATNRSIWIYARTVNPSNGTYVDARLSFYSIGESLDLALLDSRVTTLMADIAAAIP